MNDGVKILLERMQTHPEEFVDATNLGSTMWSGLLNYYDNVLTLEEKKAIERGLLKIRRDKFTQLVMERILDEPTPVQIDPNTFTINTVGRDSWGSVTLQKPAYDYEKEYNKMLKLQVEIAKNKLK